ncbi:dockerin type I domain-containing protein [Methanolobus sp. ZRKC3]|uniref:dockerin type I domain-containing protein n=1 Tax=Methanolobus sp. ZRKC3 TaxID=3125786 RepID=UPI003254906F
MKVKIQHQILIVAIALIAIFMVAATASADEHEVNTLRIYGENGYSAAFPYTDPEGPFDPMNVESPMKDFVTFNPALMEDGIVANNIDSKQKVFARQWFVPEYTEPTGMVWLDDFRCTIVRDGVTSEELITEDNADLFSWPQISCEWIPDHNEYVWEDVVTDYTYMFVDKHYQPRAATAKSPTRSYWTTFWFPVADNDDAQIGLDGYDINYDGVDDMVVLKKVGDFNHDGYKDIQISSDLLGVGVGDKVQFLDHIVEVEGIYFDGQGEVDRVAVYIYYTGNDEPEQIGGLHSVDVEGWDGLSAGRHTVSMNGPQFYEPWFLEIEATGVFHDKVLMTVGRQLYTRETFFVDGAEYDVAAIYGPEYDSVKYITIRNPVPEHQDVALNDLSIVKEMIDNEEYLPLLPPFNKVHTMVDDINIPESALAAASGTTNDVCDTYYVGEVKNENAPDGEWFEAIGIHYDYDTVEERKIYDVDPLLIYFTDKDIEPRFHTNLLEMLDEGAELSSIEDDEAWKWLHIRTMPDFYKTFVYPALPDADDGTGDFLFTSSFRAENSDVCVDNGDFLCNPGNLVLPQRLMFAYDQETGAEDIYVNEIDTETNGLRVYGENNMDAAFPYTDPEAPFDPLNAEAPKKDFVTLNPAKIKAGIVVDNKDSHEKVFFRQWFVPEYDEPTGRVWLDEPNKYIWEDVVNEYTYMFVDKHFQPTRGMATPDGTPRRPFDPRQTYSFWTHFWFPAADNDANQIGLDSFDINYDGKDDLTYLMAVSDFNQDGRKDVALGSEIFALAVGDRIQFLDHIVEIEGIYYDGQGEIDRVAVKVFYNGNNEQNPTYPGPEQIGGLHSIDVEQGLLSSGRHTVSMGTPNFYEPWVMQIFGTSTDSSKVLIRVARLVHTGESFFVDGAEYAVAMIYGPEENSVKYITIRNPIPEHQDVKLNDLSVTKEMVDNNEIMPVLPPFNGNHIMIDDIDVVQSHKTPNEYLECYYGQYRDFSATDDLLWYHDQYIGSSYDTVAERMFVDVPATEIYFTGKDYEDRFHTNLLEILREGCLSVPGTAQVAETPESWKWLHIHTMPDFYKEFVYPDVPNAGGNGDYLLTSSFTAPNTEFCDNVDFPTEYPRMMFTFDPTDGTGIYMNGGAPALPPVVDEMKGDSNGDGHVNIIDFAAFAQAYNTVVGDEKYNVVFDFNDDDKIDIIDFAAFAQAYEF